MAMSVILVSFMFSIFLFPLVTHWILGFVGVFLAMSFIVLFPTAVTQVIAIVGERAYTRGRRLVLGTIGLALGARRRAGACARSRGSILGFFRELTASSRGRVAARPLRRLRPGHHGIAVFSGILQAGAGWPWPSTFFSWS